VDRKNERSSKPKTPRDAEESNRSVGALVGGAILGASLGGPAGAVIGGLMGLFLADNVNKTKRNQEGEEDKS
jgi:outer membrane lipoprotein SlyB